MSAAKSHPFLFVKVFVANPVELQWEDFIKLPPVNTPLCLGSVINLTVKRMQIRESFCVTRSQRIRSRRDPKDFLRNRVASKRRALTAKLKSAFDVFETIDNNNVVTI